MATECASCQTACGEDNVVCAQCKGTFHFGCSGVSESTYRTWKPERQRTWKCSLACRQISQSNQSGASVVQQGFDQSITSVQCISQKLAELCNCVNALTATIQSQSGELKSVLNTVKTQGEKIAVQEKKIEEQNMEIGNLKTENGKLKKSLNEVKQTVVNLDQYGRNRNIEIHGIQHREGEDLNKIVGELAKQLRIPFVATDIDIIHRVPRKDKKKRKVILVQFISRRARGEWLKKRKTGLVSNNLVAGSDNEKIFVNVNLSPQNRELFWKARVAKKDLQFKFVWVTSSGDILMKKNENTEALLIKTEDDIPNLQKTRPQPWSSDGDGRA